MSFLGFPVRVFFHFLEPFVLFLVAWIAYMQIYIIALKISRLWLGIDVDQQPE